LQVFDQRQFEHFQVVCASNYDGNLGKADLLRRAPAAFARDQFKSSAYLSNNERLNDAMLPNRVDQFLQCFAREIFARLQRAGNDVCQIDLMDSLSGLHRVWARRDRRSAN
jgi:hypothetical protein